MSIKKRLTALLLTMVMMIGILPTMVLAANGTLSGSGSAAEPYLIANAAELKAFRDLVNSGENPTCAKLTADIDLEGEEWTPITSLTGYLDGDGHTISNLTLKGGNGSYNYQSGTVYVNTGLIGELNGSVINLKLNNVNITDAGQYNNIGALVGKIADGSTSKIDNCTVSGTATSSKGNGNTLIGGLVGMVSGATGAHTILTINNCVSNVTLTGASSNYVGGFLGSAQYFSEVTITKCAELGNISGRCNSGGVIGYINSASTALSLSDSYVGGKIDGSKKYGIAYNLSALSSLQCVNFYYDNEKNKGASSWDSFDMLKSGNYSVTATGESTANLKALHLDGFAVREGEFESYPVPVYTKATPLPLPKIAISALVEFTDTDNGTVEVKNPSGTVVDPDENGKYTLTEIGEYTYTVKDMEQYKDIAGTFEIGQGDDKKTKLISVPHEYKDVALTGSGTQEDPIRISTALELRSFANKVNHGELSDAYVQLEDNITVPGSWTPLGKNAASPFCGHFDGQNHSVTITVDDPNLSYYGFFGCLDSKADRDSATPIADQPTVTVKNLTVNGTIYCSEPYAHVGGLAARARGKVNIENCINNTTVSSLARTSAGVGGLIGSYDDGLEYVYWNIRMTVDGCTNNGTIHVTGANTDAFVGGLVGANVNCVQIKDSHNTGTIYAPGCTVGGLLGQAGYQTGDYAPSITDSSNTGTLIGAPGKTNNLYGKGTIRNITGSGDNIYTGNDETEQNELLQESKKYLDVLAVPSHASTDTVVTLLKDGETAADGITVTCSQGERDTNKAYLKVENGKLKLAQINNTGKVIEATATITWSKDGKSLSKPITINIYPAANGNASVRKTLMDNIAVTYANSSSDWAVFDMAAYAACGFGSNTTDKQNYLNLTINELAGTSPLVTDRAKAEIILAALGVDSTNLKPLDGDSYSNAAKLAAMNFGSSHYTAPWVLLAEQAGQLALSDAQRNSMIALLTDNRNLGENGLFFTQWAGETYEDPDTTGTALAALAKYNTAEYPKVQAFVNKAVSGLSNAQRSNGSFGNVNSDAMVIVGLTALGIDPATDTRFVKGGCSLADALLLYVNDGNNGFTTGYASGTQGEKAQALATEQGFRALIALEKCASLNGQEKSYNIYTQTVQISQNGNTTVSKPDKPDDGFISDDTGKIPSQGDDSTGGSTSGTTNKWITAVVHIGPSTNGEWYNGSVRICNDATAEQALKTAAENGGMKLDIRDGYLRAVSYKDTTLNQYDQGVNSGWIYKVNGKTPNMGIADYKLTGGETISLYYTADYTKEKDVDMSKPSSGGGSSSTGQTDQQKADAAAKLIAAIGTVTKDSGNTISAARTAYDNLTAEQKKLVSNYEKLTAAEKTYADLTSAEKLNFTDVTTQDYFYQAVLWAVQNKITSGVTDTTFAPQTNCTRAQMVTFLWRAAGSPQPTTSQHTFTDVAVGAYYEPAVLWAVEKGITTGTSTSTFSPDMQCSRGQMAAFLYRSNGSPAVNASNTFTDVQEQDYFANAVIWAAENNITNGIGDGKYGPAQDCTRSQIVTFLWRLYANK